jgi:hypothetical protein
MTIETLVTDYPVIGGSATEFDETLGHRPPEAGAAAGDEKTLALQQVVTEHETLLAMHRADASAAGALRALSRAPRRRARLPRRPPAPVPRRG